jgi:hypothetical protein
LLYRHYAQVQDRQSAYEILTERLQGTLSEKEQAAQEKADAKAQKEQEKIQKEQAKIERQEAVQKKKFWGAIATTVVVPLAKQVISAFFKGSKKR